jgi:hypothetical protein
MTSLPGLFESHGVPILALEDSPARRYLTGPGPLRQGEVLAMDVYAFGAVESFERL